MSNESINKSITLNELFERYPESYSVLARHGFHALSCPAELYISLESVAERRGISIKYLLADLDKFIERKSH